MKRSKLRNFLTWGFHLLVMLVAGGRVRDTQCGFKVCARGGGGSCVCARVCWGALKMWGAGGELALALGMAGK